MRRAPPRAQSPRRRRHRPRHRLMKGRRAVLSSAIAGPSNARSEGPVFVVQMTRPRPRRAGTLHKQLVDRRMVVHGLDGRRELRINERRDAVDQIPRQAQNAWEHEAPRCLVILVYARSSLCVARAWEALSSVVLAGAPNRPATESLDDAYPVVASAVPPDFVSSPAGHSPRWPSAQSPVQPTHQRRRDRSPRAGGRGARAP